MNRILALICFAALASGAAQAGPVAGRTLVLDVANQDGSWSNLSTRGEAYYLKVDLRNRGQSYTNNDLTGYLWYATNSLSAAGVKINNYSKETGAVYFYLSATNTLGLSTNAESYFAQIILTNATGSIVYDWKQGRFVTRHGSGLTGTGVSPSVQVIDCDVTSFTGTLPWSGSGISGGTATTIVHNVTDAGFAAATNYTDTATNTLRVWVQAQGYGTGGAVTSVFGRAGVVTAQAGDYTAGQVGAMTSGAVTSLVNSATQALATVAHTGAYGDLSGTPTIPSTNGLDTVIARAAAVAASTQTIAGASVSGTVPSASDATNCLDLAGSRAMTGTLHVGAVSPVGLIFPGVDISSSTMYDGSGESSLEWNARQALQSEGQVVFDWQNQILYSTNGYASIFWEKRIFYNDWTAQHSLTVSNQLYVHGGGNVVTNGGNAGTLTNIPGSQVVGTVPSAAEAANSTNFNGQAASFYMPASVTNGATSGTNLTGSVFSDGVLKSLGSAFTAAGTSAVQAAQSPLTASAIAAAGGVTNIAGLYMDAYRTPYVISTYSLSTVTVSRAYGDSVALALTNNATITFNMAEWPTNSMACLALSLHPNGFSTTFDTSCISANGATNTVPGSAGLALQTNTWNLLTFVHAYGWTNWGVRQ